MSSMEIARRAQIARAFAEERNKQNAADVTKLLALAKSLNEGFAVSSSGASASASSEDQLRKLKEIEKLAGRVKHRTAAPTTLQVSLPQ
jgi:hypothetical protein